MSKGYGNLGVARDLREILRLDDLRGEGEPLQVRGAVFTTHDLNLRFVLTELLPGLLPDPTVVPPGMSSGHRTYRSAMVDLPPVALLFAPEASVSCDTPWRPPALDLFAYRGPRRQHSKVSAILYSQGNELCVRLVAASANLTRRAFAGNLEVAAFEDYPVGGRAAQWPSLVALRALLTALASDSNLGTSRAFGTVLEHLPERANKRADQMLQFIHSADPDAFRTSVGGRLGSTPDGAGEYERALIVSPFFSAQGDRLHEFLRNDLHFSGYEQHAMDIVMDGRDQPQDASRHREEPFSTPPPWLAKYRGRGSATYRPAIIRKSRDGTPRGTGDPGRPLHAKVLAVGYRRQRARTDRLVWRVLVGSANFTESGFGLKGNASNLEAGFLLDHSEEVPNEVFGPRSGQDALCVAHELADEEERVTPDLEAMLGATSAAKDILRVLDGGALDIQELPDGRYKIRLDLAAAKSQPVHVSLGKDQTLNALADGAFELIVGTLAPYYLAIRCGDMTFSWPLPTRLALVENLLLADTGGRRRADRLMEFWLRRTGQPLEPDEEDLESEMLASVQVSQQASDGSPLGSWRLNRLLLGVRRRLAESAAGKPPRLPAASGVLATIRVRELLALFGELPVADRLYFGELLRAMLLGYRAAEAKRAPSWADANAAEVPAAWRQEPAWHALEQGLEAARASVNCGARRALSEAAEPFFLSVRDGELVE